MSLDSDEIKVLELYTDFDLRLYYDLFGWCFVSDTHCRYYSPSFREVTSLGAYLKQNADSIRKELEK